MKKTLLVFASLFFATQTFANDSAISGTSGTPGNLKATVLAGEHKSVRMVREQIEMRIGRTDYVTDAHFVFHNDGAATTVRMGFPEGAGGDADFAGMRKKTSFKEFETWVDGKRIKATRMVSSVRENDFEAYWVKSVLFTRGQTRRVRVRYRSELGETTDPSHYVFYDFTGGNWKGKVDESTLRVKFSTPGDYQILRFGKEIGKPLRRVEKDSLFLRWRNWQAEADFLLHFIHTLPGALVCAESEKELDERSKSSWSGENLAVRNAQKYDPWKAESIHWNPSGVLHDGRAFIAVRDFADRIRSQVDSASSMAIIPPNDWKYSWDAQSGSLRFEWPTNGNEAKRHILLLSNGAFLFKLDGKIHDLPVSLFMAGKPGNRQLYIPLAPLVEALGGKVKVNTKTMRYWFEVPV